jgi:Asp-tRNA(Asn)/Glu-tRNA(Gln) amidotransferase A subunit family amidase
MSDILPRQTAITPSGRGRSEVPTSGWARRDFLTALAAAGAGGAVFTRALTALAQEAGAVSPEMIRQAEWISGMEFTEEERELMADGVGEAIEGYTSLRAVPLDNGVPPALRFDATGRGPVSRPDAEEDLAFMTIAERGGLLRRRVVSSEQLTRLYLERLQRYDPVLRCVITLTPDLALEQARRADREIASGQIRGPLHGIPWGAKDLISVPGYPTTWGAAPYRDQVRPERATVATRLEVAGAVLVAKLSVGALAWGDVWFDATTKNPWNTEQGSSGSSAGPGSATAAGLVGFSIGTETWGSIVSPSTRCGVTGLRPTFGRVSRHGVMALSWSMDKIGPMCRSAEDCALVFRELHGSDGLDPSAVDAPFAWPATRPATELRIGYVPELFEDPDEPDTADMSQEEAGQTRAEWRNSLEWRVFDRRTLDELRDLGFGLIPVTLPSEYSIRPLGIILTAEASTAFDELTRTGRDDLLVRQIENAWPNEFRQGQLIPAVEYIRANRIRSLLMRDMDAALADVDVLVTPSFGGDQLLLTNLTGHPATCLPNGFRSADGTPTSITFVGRLFGETDVLSVASAWQEATGYHCRRPPV